MGINVIWTAEFANQKWLKDLSQVIAQRSSEFIPSTVATGKYQGKNWASPYASNAALLYYRSDQVVAGADELGGRLCGMRPRTTGSSIRAPRMRG